MTLPRTPPPTRDVPEPLVPRQHGRTLWCVIGGTVLFHAVAALVLWQVAQSTQTGAIQAGGAVGDDVAMAPSGLTQPPETVAAGAADGGRFSREPADARQAPIPTHWLTQSQRKDRAAPWGVDRAGNVVWHHK